MRNTNGLFIPDGYFEFGSVARQMVGGGEFIQILNEFTIVVDVPVVKDCSSSRRTLDSEIANEVFTPEQVEQLKTRGRTNGN